MTDFKMLGSAPAPDLAACHDRLPIGLRRSMEAVMASAMDAPFDTADSLFRCGHGVDVPRQ